MTARARTLVALVAAASLAVAGCSSDDDGADRAGSSTTAGAVTTTTEPAGETLTILVSNDDGYAAEGIDVLVTALAGLPDTEVVVYAPKEQRSGSGGKSTEGDLEVTDVALASGTAAKAVDGFPADTIRVAMDEAGVTPDLVVTGINEGQNVGPFIDVSGTVGAARAAVARGVPALATSQGLAEDLAYEDAVAHILGWVTEHRDALLAGEAPVEVTNLNVPSCATGEVRGEVEVEVEATADAGDALSSDQDCTSTVAEADLAGDVEALNNGFATRSVLPAEPAA